MRNRPTPIYAENQPSRSGAAWDMDAEPALRLTWLFVVMALPLFVVAGRLVQLQWFLAAGFAVDERRESVSFEPIPSRHGRIIAADGTVLAFDEEMFQVVVHYRWLEEPPNQRWLRDEAMTRLSRSERRDKQKLAAAMQQVLNRRAAMWGALAEMTDHKPEELTELRQRVQKRVERIFKLVNERQTRPQQDNVADKPEVTLSGDSALPTFSRAWDVVKRELTTSPTRERRDSLHIPEQSDYHVLLENVSSQECAGIETQPDRFPGVRTDVTTRRVYPHGRVAPHLVGHRGAIEQNELDARSKRYPHGDPLDYQAGDSIGKSGVEQSYEEVLRGVRGQRKIVRDGNGIVNRVEVVEPPKIGRDVILSFNVALQEQATALLNEIVEGDPVGRFSKPSERSALAATEHDKAHGLENRVPEANRRPPGACLVAINVQTGEIVAAATAPTFDINDWLSGSSDVREALLADTRSPMFPRATQMKLPPGSVFKTVSAVALLESGMIDPDRPIECVGYLDTPKKNVCYTFTHYGHGHYATDLTKALAASCNVYFFKAARTIGPHPLVDWAERFGFGQPTGIDVRGEERGHLPRPPQHLPTTLANGNATEKRTKKSSGVELASHEQLTSEVPGEVLPISPWGDESPVIGQPNSSAAKKSEPWYPGSTLGLAIGQDRLTVTPIQVARMMAAIGNDGWLVTPHVVREIAATPETGPLSDSDRQRVAKSLWPSELLKPIRRQIEGLSDGTLARIREGLEQVVAATYGTGFKTVRMKEVQIAGKTGTAETGKKGGLDHAWFAGYVPADRPQVAFVVVLEQAGSGGKEAGPVAKKFVQLLLDQHVIRTGR
ncbi:MAG: penicillin-binding transpeptidase domain-containing protein [Planctomycetia bacterium]|nr:penicillin-binding transpeptidase domain-containing protein [Planctomycetia bacterium]